jgi:hypothetical protein
MLAIIWHSRTGAARAMAAAAAEGAAQGGAAFTLLPAEMATSDDCVAAQGFLFVCPENLGSMSGEMKAFFDRCYYPLLGRVEGRPYATAIAAGTAGQGRRARSTESSPVGVSGAWHSHASSLPVRIGPIDLGGQVSATYCIAKMSRFGTVAINWHGNGRLLVAAPADVDEISTFLGAGTLSSRNGLRNVGSPNNRSACGEQGQGQCGGARWRRCCSPRVRVPMPMLLRPWHKPGRPLP